MASDFNPVVAVVGLGYVGLPLAVNFGKKFRTIGYDINHSSIENYRKHVDPMGEVSRVEFAEASLLEFESEPEILGEVDYIIVAVPTPIDPACQPDLQPVKDASEKVGKYMKKGAVVIFESTVYPGVTEEVCVPILETVSGFKWKRDFHVGYSPERINPGDREHTLTKIIKIVSGDDPDTLEQVARLYESIIEAGVYRVDRIKEAEAAKVIENTQRDLNIALMNELSIIFDKLGIDTLNVLEAAGTKWNFLNFRPGLVGGHCIGVDPYYLTYKAETSGFHPDVILAGRRINDSMGKFVAEKTIRMMIDAGKNIKGGRVGIIGLTFKEDCPDLRNSKVVDIVRVLESYGVTVLVHDPIANPLYAKNRFDIELCDRKELNELDALILAVPHREYREAMAVHEIAEMLAPDGCLIDVKSTVDTDKLKELGIRFWRL